MKIQRSIRIPALSLVLSLAQGLAQAQAPVPDAQRPVATKPSDEAGPLFLRIVDVNDPDEDIGDKLSRSRHAEGSAARHYEKGMLYKQAANHLYNQSRYKQAYGLYRKAEAELMKAAEKSDRDAEAKAKRDAYYHLGLVCEKIRNDKSIAAECFAKARELDPEADFLALKLSRTKEGRARLGVASSSDFKRLSEPREDRDALEGAEEQPQPKSGDSQ